jgi:FtsP/CotA-like multicopper oxidase with cupredoxin domain
LSIRAKETNMQTITRNIRNLTIVLVVLAAIISAGFSSSTAYAATCAPTVLRDLYAQTGTATLYDSISINIWGYSTDGLAATLPGPVLDVNQGDCVQVTLYNVDIPESTALLFQGQELIPDTTGVAAGGTAVYTFLASRPGTFLYEAGLLPNAQHQVAMGLYGALIVRPATAGQAYDDIATTFDKESVLVLSELDTALNTVLPAVPNANPGAFDMRDYNPKYLLINGKAFQEQLLCGCP